MPPSSNLLIKKRYHPKNLLTILSDIHVLTLHKEYYSIFRYVRLLSKMANENKKQVSCLNCDFKSQSESEFLAHSKKHLFKDNFQLPCFNNSCPAIFNSFRGHRQSHYIEVIYGGFSLERKFGFC